MFTILIWITVPISIYLYLKGNKFLSLMFAAFYATEGFYAIPDNIVPLITYIWALTFYVIILNFVFFFRKRFWRKNDTLSKIIIIIILYTFLNFFYTLYTRAESLNFATKELSRFIMPLLYFIVLGVEPKVLKRIFLGIFILISLIGIVYIFQALVGETWIGRNFTGDTSDVSYKRNASPIIAKFILIYLLFTRDIDVKYKYILIPYYIVLLIMPLSRSPIISLLISVILYFLLSARLKQVFLVLISSVSVLLLLFSVFQNRFIGKGHDNIVNDISLAITTSDYMSYNSDEEGGTFLFRTMLLRERVEYLLNNPKYLFQGVGMLHEDSPSTKFRFNFLIGSSKTTEKGIKVIQSLDSTDLIWASLIMRLGLIGVTLYLIMAFYWIIFFFKNRLHPFAIIGFIFCLANLIDSFSKPTLFEWYSLLIVFMCYTIVFKEKKFMNISITNHL